MEYYEYKSKNRLNGKIARGIVTADDISSAEEHLKKRGEDIIEISPMQDFLNIRKKIFALANKCNRKTKLEFFSMLKFMLGSGMSLHESLVNIRDSSSERSLKNLSRTLADEVRQGADLSTALKKSGQFDNSEVQQINAGEESGTVDETITRLIGQYEREIELKSKIRSASIYPAVICLTMFVVLWIMMTVIVPSLVETLISMGGELPLITKIVIGTSKAMSISAPYLFIAIVTAFFGYRQAVKIEKFRMVADSFKLKIPIIGKIIRKLELGRFCRNLSAMQKSGITLVGSMQTVQAAIKNTVISKAVEKATRLIEISGMNLSNALSKSGNFPVLMLQMIEIGVESGKICDVLDKVASQYENEVDTGLKRLLGIIEPVLILLVGFIVGIVVISIFMPLFSMTEII